MTTTPRSSTSSPEAAGGGRRERTLALLRRAASPLVSVALFALALWTLHREFARLHYADVTAALGAIAPSRLGWAALLTLASFTVLTFYDALAVRWLGLRLPPGRVALGAFVGYAFSNSVGHSLLVGTPARYRIYSALGLSTFDVTRLVAFCTATFWLGFLAMSGLSFAVEPFALPGALHLPFASVRPLGLLFLGVVLAYLLATLRGKPLTVRGLEVPMPSPPLALAQLVVACSDWTLSAAVLWSLLPDDLSISFPAFLAHYLLAQVVGLASQVPGGLGIFEGVLVLALGTGTSAGLVGSLLAFRLVYYLAPLLVAVAALAVHELAGGRAPLRRALGTVGSKLTWVPGLAPQLLAGASFVAGALLLFSGATPGVPSRLAWLDEALPLPLVEVSHLLASLAGVALLLLSRGLQRRLDAAWHLTVGLLGVGIVTSLGKGLDWEEALILTTLLGCLLPARTHFYRRTSLVAERFTAGWVAAVALAIVASIWLGLFAHRHVEYSHELWWQFTLDGDAPRFLRATFGAIGLALVVAVARLLRPALPDPGAPSPEDLARALPVVRAARETSAHLALVGDKRLLRSASGRGFVMYGQEGRSWVAMGDPVGAQEERAELVWSFRELADRHDGWTVFYQVRPETLALYVDLGLSLLKLGEEARIDLTAFSLEGSHRKGLRNAVNKLEKSGVDFEILPVDAVPSLLPELRSISDDWLAHKSTREKGFSLGFFDEDYLRRLPVAVARQGGRPIAFANLWLSGEREEASLDLMRHLEEAPSGIMDFLFVRLMLWAKGEGYRHFNLGMAPLAGLEDRRLAPLWNRLGGLAFRHGEHFYNFQGLRQYKEKFDPVWEPRYLASPGGLVLPRVLANLAALVSRGLKGVIAR